MSKPLGYYVGFTPGDGSYLDSLDKRYGSQFERMSNRDKYALITVIASHLCAELPGTTGDYAYLLGAEITEKLSVGDRSGLIEAMIAQIRGGGS